MTPDPVVPRPHSTGEPTPPGISRPAHNTTRRLDVVAVVSAGLLLVFLSLRLIDHSDFWWQYKTGEYVSSHGPPRVDVFSFTRAGAPWIEMRWLFCFLLFQTVSKLGYAAAVVASASILAIAWALVVLAVVRRSMLTAASVVLTASILTASQRFQTRPEIMTYLFFSLFLWIIARDRQRAGRAIFILPVLQIVWTNSHTLFMLGPATVGLLLATEALRGVWRGSATRSAEDGRRTRKLAIVFLATLAACLVNPYGLRGAIFPFQLLLEIHGTAFKKNIAELRATFAFTNPMTAVTWLKILIGLCVLSALGNWRRFDPFGSLLCASQLYLAATAIRNLPLFALAAIPFVLHNARSGDFWHRFTASRHSSALGATCCAAIIGVNSYYIWQVITDRFNVTQGSEKQFGVGLAANHFPFAAADFLREHRLDGPIINSMSEGACLLARGYRVCIDPRLEVYGEEFFANYMKMFDDDAAWRRMARALDAQVVFSDIALRLVNRVAAEPGWNLVYFDERAAVFVRADVHGDIPAIRSDDDFHAAVARVRREWPPPRQRNSTPMLSRIQSSRPYLRIGTLLLALGKPAMAESFLADAVAAEPDSPAAQQVYGLALQKLGRTSEAVAAMEASARLAPADATTAGLLGWLYSAQGRIALAQPLLQRSLRVQPNNAALWAVLAQTFITEQRFEEAIEPTERAVQLDPANVTLHKNLAKLLGGRGDRERMIAEFDTAARLAPGDCTIYRDIAKLLTDRNDAATARRYIDKGLQICPMDADLLKLQSGIPSTAPSRPIQSSVAK